MTSVRSSLTVLSIGSAAIMVAASGAALAAPAGGIPCSARADAVIANTGSIFSNSNSLVDSYHSSQGAYGGANVSSAGNVQAGTTVVNNGGVIHGTIVQHTPAGLSVVPVPAGAVNLPVGSGAPGTLNISNAGQSITLAPGSYVAANINLNAPGAINVSPPGPVLIWVTGNLILGGNGNLNGVPSNLQFLVTSSASVSVNSGSGRLFGFIYAPTAQVNVNGRVFGGVTGRSVVLNSGSAVHLDEDSACSVAPPTVNQAFLSMGFKGGCAINTAGNARCWGLNVHGELGNGSAVDDSPVSVPVTGLTSTPLISRGGNSACGLTSGGAAVCWGENLFGQLGDNGFSPGPCGSSLFLTCSPVPQQVVGLTSGVTNISAGESSACAVNAAGGAACWGRGDLGQLGNGGTSASLVPVPVTGLGSGVKAVGVGSHSACALTSAGAVLCWGENSFGQLGNNSTTSSLVPVQVTGLTSGVTAIAVGTFMACAINSAGGLVCWGSNTFGNLGNGSTTNSPVPVPVQGLSSGVLAVTAGARNTCVIVTGNAVKCWGDNDLGGLGNGGVSPNTCSGAPCAQTPVPVPSLTSGVIAVSSGTFGVCAMTENHTVRCWGTNDSNGLGDNGVSPDVCGTGTPCAKSPVLVVGFP